MPFADADDVAVRLGRSLTDAEEKQAEGVIATVTGLIVDSVDRDADWAKDLDPVPEALKAICVEKARAVIANPEGLASSAEDLGAYSHSRTYRRSDDVGIFLTDFEERQISRAVYGTTSGSSSPSSVVDRIRNLNEGREADEDE